MRFAFIREHAGQYPVRLLCDVLEVSVSGFYAWQDRKPSRRAVENEQLAAEIRTIHDGSPAGTAHRGSMPHCAVRAGGSIAGGSSG